MRDVYGIAAFRSRQQVMHFEDALRREGIPVGVITTPGQWRWAAGYQSALI